mgnify:CR=1 FL=1
MWGFPHSNESEELDEGELWVGVSLDWWGPRETRKSCWYKNQLLLSQNPHDPVGYLHIVNEGRHCNHIEQILSYICYIVIDSRYMVG